ncbi:MAG: hypothetical protein EOP51_29075 [Sphingobacteriales bacterium]|nr:MAG: hypothetical protein EOP51_29075 [Sphingobacteriales bacterium]
MKLRIILIAIFIAAAVASCTVTPVPVVPSIETVVTPTSCTSGVPLAVLGGKYIKGKSNYYAYHTSTVADASGNSYSAGLYSGDVDFGGTRLSGKGGYLSKSDRTGKFTWVVKLPVAYSYTATFASGKIFVQTYDYVNDKPVRTLCTYTTDGVLLSTVEIKGGVYFDDYRPHAGDASGCWGTRATQGSAEYPECVMGQSGYIP